MAEKTGVGQKFESLIERKKRKHQESPLPETTLSALYNRRNFLSEGVATLAEHKGYAVAAG